MSATRGYLEHVAIRVRAIAPHLEFFRDVLGMDLRDHRGDRDNPTQAWVFGGVQFIVDPDFAAPEGRLAHLGIFVEDLEAALAAAKAHGVKELPQGRNWLELPDGLAVELDQAKGNAVARARAIDARAEIEGDE